MYNEENLMETSEIVETTTEEIVEEPVKMYTEEEFNAKLDDVLAKKIARKEAKLRREYEEKYAGYKEAEAVLNAGLGTSNIEEATDSLRDFYRKKGVEIPTYQKEESYTEEEAGILANYEAQKIIEAGYDEVVEELAVLSAKYDNEGMTAKEQRLFRQLADYKNREDSRAELAQIGVGAEVLDDEGFKAFADKLNPKLSTKEKYEMYTSLTKKSNIEPIGSMKGTKSSDPSVKEFYSFEEASKFTREELDKNPALFEAIKRSMLKWK